MTATTTPRDTPAMTAGVVSRKVAASTKILQGTFVALNAAGYLVPMSAATTLIAQGRAEETVDNTAGAAGDLSCLVKPGIFRWANSASTDTITIAELGDTAYGVDNQTVAKTDGSSARSAAGKIVDVDAQGVWVATSIL
ncbi:MAG: hypothetical protein EOP62_14325 [Sphingomonadales bacterium]|nr:MAG: hypothetical protein EOP62_14325 [Sphingomonadales bacterium]